jgi:2-dehydropantoate 2-reductase
MDDYIRIGKRIILETYEGEPIKHGEYDFEVLHGLNWHKAVPDFHSSNSIAKATQSPLKNTIHHLIVSVKSTQTVAALRPLVPRLTRESSILFLQNGAGMIEDVNEVLWPNPNTRPSYITGVISHGVTLKGPFDIKHTGPAATSLGPVPRGDESNSPTSASTAYLLDALPRAPRLNCRSYGWPDILQRQLEKLAVNAFSNPLTALADSTVEYLFTIPRVRSALMEEISSVILALPELQGVSGVKERFSAERLDATVMEVIVQNRSTTCSMVWDMRAKRETEIRYINGYWARRGKELGVPTPINDEIVSKIQAMRAEKHNGCSGS